MPNDTLVPKTAPKATIHPSTNGGRVPAPEVASGMLATAIGADLDEIARILGHEPRKPGEPDADFRRRMQAPDG